MLGGRGMPRGIPDVLMTRNNKTQRMVMSVLPSPDLAVQMYANAGGSLPDPDSFGSGYYSNQVDI